MIYDILESEIKMTILHEILWHDPGMIGGLYPDPEEHFPGFPLFLFLTHLTKSPRIKKREKIISNG